MKAYVFSIGESTTDLCIWSLERQGFEIVLYQDNTSLWEKLKRFYNEVTDDIVLRCDADIIVNKNVKEMDLKDNLWVQALCWDWYKQDLIVSSVGLITKKVIDIAKQYIDEAVLELRPETYIWRLKEFHNPRVCQVSDLIVGLHGYKQRLEDIKRVKKMKEKRNQSENYDWKLLNKINEL